MKVVVDNEKKKKGKNHNNSKNAKDSMKIKYAEKYILRLWLHLLSSIEILTNLK